METIIQGDNKPIVLEFDRPCTNIDQLSTVLYGSNTIFRAWALGDATISGNTLSLPFDQAESMKLTGKFANLEVKIVENGKIEFFETITLYVKARQDKTMFGGV